jgi:Tol biopolymer transport system component
MTAGSGSRCWRGLPAALIALLTACGGSQGLEGAAAGQSSAASTPSIVAPVGDVVAYQVPTDPAGVVVTDEAGAIELATGADVPGRQQTNPDWSPDGQRLVMAVSDGERDDLWTVGPDGSDPQLLLDCSGDCLYLDDPAWSPDGTQVLYSRIPYDHSRPTLEAVAVSDGSTRVLLSAEPGSVFSGPRWSPDGTEVLFERAELDPAGSGEVVGVSLIVASVADPDSDPRQLTDPKAFAVTPDWGPNGERIVFSARPEPGLEASDLYTVEPDGEGLTRVTRLAESGGSAVEPAWAPDGATIWFVASGAPGGGDGLAVVDAGGGEVGPAIGGQYVAGAHPRVRPSMG